MTDTIAPVHLYKLVSGETVIGFFFGQHELGVDRKAHHLVTKPWVVTPNYHRFQEWIIGLRKQDSVMIPLVAVIAIVETDLIDPILVERFLSEVGYPGEHPTQ